MQPGFTSQLQLGHLSGSIAEICDKVGRYSPHKRSEKSIRVEPYRELSPRKPTSEEVLPLLSPRFFTRRPSPPHGETTHGRFFGVPHATFDVCDRAAYQRNKARQVSQWRDCQTADTLGDDESSRAAKREVKERADDVCATEAASPREIARPPPRMGYADRALPMLDREKAWLQVAKKRQVSPPKLTPRDRLDALKAARSSRHSDER